MEPVHVFVLGTGRSGTKTVSKLLSRVPGSVVKHEIRPVLLEEATNYFSGNISKNKMISILSQTRSKESIGGEQLSGEANLRLALLLPELSEAFPKARYLWVLRDGRNVVASLHNRYWYHPRETVMRSEKLKIWASNRIAAHQVGEMSKKEWDSLDRFGRCCWYWSYVNRLIEEKSSNLGLNIYTCKLELLNNELANILEFLSIKQYDYNKLIVSKENPTRGRSPLKWLYWSKKQKAMFKDLAGPVMDKYYPGWEEEMNLSRSKSFKGFYHRQYYTFLSLTWPVRRKIGLTRAPNLRSTNK